jgi:hypothetical protein
MHQAGFSLVGIHQADFSFTFDYMESSPRQPDSIYQLAIFGSYLKDDFPFLFICGPCRTDASVLWCS